MRTTSQVKKITKLAFWANSDQFLWGRDKQFETSRLSQNHHYFLTRLFWRQRHKKFRKSRKIEKIQPLNLTWVSFFVRNVTRWQFSWGTHKKFLKLRKLQNQHHILQFGGFLTSPSSIQEDDSMTKSTFWRHYQAIFPMIFANVEKLKKTKLTS